MTDHDDNVSRRYRELPREEPPAALDAAIVASARQAVAPRRSHWTRVLSIAAVLVLAVGITLRMQHEEPGIETAIPQPAAPAPAPQPSSQPSTAETAAPIKKRSESRATQPAQRAAPQRAGAPTQRAPAAPQDRATAGMALPEPTTGAAATNAPAFDSAKNAAPAPQAPAAAGAAPASEAQPARVTAPSEKRAKDLESAPAADARLEELERIAKLREAGNDAEADAALAEFRRRNPGYRIPDAMWARVKAR